MIAYAYLRCLNSKNSIYQLNIGILESSAYVDKHTAIFRGEMLSFLKDGKLSKREGKVLYLKYKLTIATIASPSLTLVIIIKLYCFRIYLYKKLKMLSLKTLIALFTRYDRHVEIME